jgi:hypothetical protein
MFEGMLNIDIGENEVGIKLLACANARQPFEVFGRQYMVEGISRNFDGVNGWIRAEMRQLVKPEWRGPEDGLPPVGLRVRVAPDDHPHEAYAAHVGHEVEIIAHDTWDGRPVAVYRVVLGSPEVQLYHALIAQAFQSIPDAAEIAHRERINGVAALRELMGGQDLHEAAERLYKAGVRAPEVK